MKVIIAGSRRITDYEPVEQAIAESGFKITQVICGCADGVDLLGHLWARNNIVPVSFCPAWENQHKWARSAALKGEYVEDHFGYLGKGAGLARNASMALRADALIAVRCAGKSNGTDDMITKAQQRGLKVYVKHVDPIPSRQ